MNTITTLQKKQYNEETHNIYNTDKTKTYNVKNNRYTDEHCYNKTRYVNNNITNSISKNTVPLIMNIILKKDHSSKTVSATTINHRLLMLKTIKGLIAEHSITQITNLKL